jgi:hypothetical protein
MDDEIKDLEASTRSQIVQTTLDEVKNRQQKDEQAEDCCVICLDKISQKAHAVPCNHSAFDFLCLASWLEQRNSCPLCNAKVSAIHYDIVNEKTYKVYNVTKTENPLLELPISELDSEHDILITSSTRRPGFPRTRIFHPQRHQTFQSRSRPPYIRPEPQTEDEALARRREVYHNNSYSLHVGSNRVSRFRELTPELFSRDSELQSRARKWIRRELQVFGFLSSGRSFTTDILPLAANATRRANNAEFLLEYIIAILKTVDIQGSHGQAQEMIGEFLGRNIARLFLHELRAWLRSPFTELKDWDRNVQYAPRNFNRYDELTPQILGHFRPPVASRAQNGPFRGWSDRRSPGSNRRLDAARRRYNPD